MMELLSEYRGVTVIIHAMVAAIGLGGATVSDILFFGFLRDGKISDKERETLRTLSRIIWTAITFIVITGIALYLPATARLGASSKFLLKVVVVAVIIVNGSFLHFFIAPKLTQIAFTATGAHRRLRRIAFALGSISIVSWYSAFILGSIRSIPLSFPVLLVLYGLLLLCAITGSQIVERLLARRAKYI